MQHTYTPALHAVCPHCADCMQCIPGFPIIYTNWPQLFMRDAWYVGKAKRHCFADKRFWVPLWKLQPILQVIQPIWWFHLSIIYTQFGCINLEQLYSHIGCIKTESSDWLIIIHPYWEYNLNENILAAPTPNMLPHPLNNNKVSFGVVISCWKPGLLKNLIGGVLQAHITIFSVIFKVLRQWKY